MFSTLLLIVGLSVQGQQVVQGGPPPPPVPKSAPATLPATPQGKRVQAFIDAFNTGDEQKFLKAQEELMAPNTLARRPQAERAKMYGRMKGDFGTLKVRRAVAAGDTIRVVIPDKDGNEAIFSFELEPKAPYKILGIAVDIGNVER